MTTLLIHYTVADFQAFKPVFDDFGTTRRAHGALGHRLLRMEGDPAGVVVLIDFPSASSAHAFLDDPLRRDALQRAGVVLGTDRVEFLERIEGVGY